MVDGTLRLLLKRESIDLNVSPGWPGEGLDYLPDDHELEGDLGTPPPPLPAPDDGGAMVGWTQGGMGRAAWLGRIRGGN